MNALCRCTRGHLQVSWWHCMFLDLLYNKNCHITTTRADLFAFLCRGEEVSPCICFQTSQAQRYFGLTDSPGSKLIWIDRLPRLQADEFTDSQGSRPQLQAHLDWQTAPAPGSFGLTDCWGVNLLFSMESCYFMLMYIYMYVSTHCGVFENYNQFFWFTSCYTGCAGIHALEVLQQGDMGLAPIRETAKMTVDG